MRVIDQVLLEEVICQLTQVPPLRRRQHSYGAVVDRVERCSASGCFLLAGPVGQQSVERVDQLVPVAVLVEQVDGGQGDFVPVADERLERPDPVIRQAVRVRQTRQEPIRGLNPV